MEKFNYNENVKILGWYSDKIGNIGDESYKISLPLLLPNYNFEFINDPKQIKPNELVLLGGGDVLSLLDNIPSKNIIPISITASELLKFNNFAWVRDKQSQNNLSNSTLLPDAAFILEPNKSRGRQLIENYFKKYNHHLYKKIVGVVINSNMMSDHMRIKNSYDLLSFLKMSYDLSNLFDSTNASFIFIPFGRELPWDDKVSNGYVASLCKWWQKNFIIYDNLDVQDTLDIISATDVNISSRLHSSIFSLISEVPFIDLTYSHKNKWFLDSIGLHEVSVSYENFNIDRIQFLLNDFLNGKNLINLKAINTLEKNKLKRGMDCLNIAIKMELSKLSLVQN